MTTPRVDVTKHEGYRTIVVNGIYGGHRPGFFEAIIYSDELVGDEALASVSIEPSKAYVHRTIQCRLVIDPFQAKSFAGWLNQHIAEYEKQFGQITETKQETEGKPSDKSIYV